MAVCEDHESPFRAFADAYFARYPAIVWEGSRGFAGKSYLLATLIQTEAITLGAEATVLGGSLKQSQNVHEYITSGWDAPLAPRWMLATDPTKTEIKLDNGGKVQALTASQRQARGPHPQRLRLDEVDEMKVEVMDAALGQPMEGDSGIRTQIVFSSTHQHPDGTMTEVKRRAEKAGWPVMEWCYRECLEPHGWLTEREVQEKRSVVPSVMWESEYELQEPSPTDRAFDPDAVDAAFNARLGTWDGQPKEEVVLIPPEEGGPFYHGADWAKTSDSTVIATFERREGTDRLAAWQRLQKLPWPVMVEAFNERVGAYGGRACHDATGVGEFADDMIQVRAEGFDFRRQKDRHQMLSDYIAALEDGRIEYPMIRWAYHEHKYASYNDLFGSGHLPDSVCAGALAWHARKRSRDLTARDMRLKYWG